MEQNTIIKWKRTNSGNIMFARYKGVKRCFKSTLTDDWQDRLEVDEWDANVYDIIIAKPRTKEPHIDYIFHNEPSWSGEITIERWDELKRMPFSELYLSLVGVRYEGKEFTFGKYKGQTLLYVLNTNPNYIEWCKRTIPNFAKEMYLDEVLLKNC